MENVSSARLQLLLQMESIVGAQCVNANTLNWGPNGVLLGEGRRFRYPVTFIEAGGVKRKRSYSEANVPNDIPLASAMSGYYAFGANQLQIVSALNRVLGHLEQNHNFQM